MIYIYTREAPIGTIDTQMALQVNFFLFINYIKYIKK